MPIVAHRLADTIANKEQAVGRPQSVQQIPLPSTPSEINHYVENLLSIAEQRICDMATD